MSDADRVLELFAQTNPVPSTDTLAIPPASASIVRDDTRSAHMSDTTTVRPILPDGRPPGQRSRWLVGVAAALAVVVAIGALLFAASRTDDSDVASAEKAALDAVEDAISAYNAGDVDTWMAAFADDAIMFRQRREVDPEGTRQVQAFFMAFDQELDLDCMATGGSVRCAGTATDALWNGAGMEPGSITITAQVDSGEIIRIAWSGDDPTGLIGDIAEWIAETRPDYWDDRFVTCLAERNCRRTAEVAFLMTPDSAAALLEVLPDYVEATTVAGIVDDFVMAYNSGDDAAAVALLAPDVTASDTWGPIDIVRELAWFTAQGATLDSVSCRAATSNGEASMLVVCQYDTLDALTQAVEAPPIPTTTRFTVTDAGITTIRIAYGEPDFTLVGLPFRRWLAEHRPDVTCLAFYTPGASCEEPASIEAQREDGRRVARYAQEWAAYLDGTGCRFDQGC